MSAAQILANVKRTAATRERHEREDRAAMGKALLAAREHPEVNMNDAARAAGVSRVGAYELARSAEDG